MKKTLTALAIVALAGGAFAFEVKQTFKEPRLARGNTNVRILQPIDLASWIWSPEEFMWGVEADCAVWSSRMGKKQLGCCFYRFRKEFEFDGSPLRFDISADERFVLYLDGEQIARGPQRGLVEHWYYQSYEVTGLEAGKHVLEAVVWQVGANAALAQLSYRGGFILSAEAPYADALTTGKAEWQVAKLVNTVATERGVGGTFGTGSQYKVTGTGFANERGENWQKATVVREPVFDWGFGACTKGWKLFPADRPDQMYELKTPGKVVNVERDLTKPFEVAANTELDLWWDLDDYYCAYPELETAGGKGATVTWGWCESLRNLDQAPNGRKRYPKNNRNEWKGKEFGTIVTDTFVSDGRADAFFTSPWWRCGRWCRVTIKTADEPLTVRRVAIGETRYPYAYDSVFESNDETLKPVIAICRRAIEMCSHEMLFDCPYYEQQMYPGDTRIQLQIINSLTRDPRLARFAMSVYDWDRRSDGMIDMNYPTRGTQESSTYTMCWIMMFRDYLMWHDDAEFLKWRMPGVRNALMGLALYENADGLLQNLPGWSFMDWVTGDQPFEGGVAPDGVSGVSALNNLQYLLAIESAAAVDAAIGEKELAAHWQAKAKRLGEAIVAKFMSAERGIISDTLDHKRFSEHAQAMAILADILTPAQRVQALSALTKGEGLAPVSSYFAYYLFDALTKCGRADVVMARLGYWHKFIEWGARTAFETQAIDARSDCHGWSACPLYFLQTAFAGVTPASPFFRTVRVAPQPAGLKHIHAKTPCPQGTVETDLSFGEDGSVKGFVTLPEGMTGVFEWKGAFGALKPGKNEIK